MSTETPRNSGAGEPIPPHRVGGGISGFLRRFFGASETQQVSISATNVQPPLGLENFASGIKQGINTQLELKRQQELEKISESLRMSARIAELKTEEQRKIREIEEKERRAEEEGTRILKSLRVAERLKYIQDKVWEGRGQITATEGVRGLYHGSQSLSTLELNYQFPALRAVQSFETDWVHGGSVNSYWQHVPVTASTSLIVEAVDVGVAKGTPDMKVRIFSEVKLLGGEDKDHAEVCHVFIPTGKETTEQELETALVQETALRVKRNFTPPGLEEFEKEALKIARRSPGWQKWVSGDYNSSGGYYHESIGYRR